MGVRFLHTADWQLGMRFQAVGSAAEKVRGARFQSIQRIVDLAHERDVGLLLVAGDVFDDNGVDRFLVRKVGELLARYRGQVFILPGNHDPLVPGSVWEHSVWTEVRNVCVLRDPQPIEFDEWILYPCPLTEKYSSRDPTHWIDARETAKIAVGMAHGNVEGLPDTEPDYPIPRDAPRRAGLDYLALGHWHSHAEFSQSDGIPRMAYSGTHETTKFGERDSGKVLLVEIEARGQAPRIEPWRTGEFDWRTLDLSIGQPGGLDSILESLRALESPGTTLLRVRLDGLLLAADRTRLATLEETLAARFMHGMLDATRVVPAPHDDAWIESLPAGPIRGAASRLREIASRGDEAEQAVATQALMLLFELQEKPA